MQDKNAGYGLFNLVVLMTILRRVSDEVWLDVALMVIVYYLLRLIFWLIYGGGLNDQ